ncbi:MAG: hypothetical protein R2940_09165 [Syntrophotaleaceae bacterium]
MPDSTRMLLPLGMKFNQFNKKAAVGTAAFFVLFSADPGSAASILHGKTPGPLTGEVRRHQWLKGLMMWVVVFFMMAFTLAVPAGAVNA